MLERRVKDPRLGFVTVTEARLTNDLREATVYYTVYGTDAERADTALALHSATGIIRSEVGRQIGLRHTPSLEFVADVVPERPADRQDLVSQARNRRRGTGPQPRRRGLCRRPDPYRKPAEDSDEDDFDA